MPEFQQIAWDSQLEQDCRSLVRLALAEDLGGKQDVTTRALVPETQLGAAKIVAREPGTSAGMQIVPLVLAEAKADLAFTLHMKDGQRFAAGTELAELTGNARALLTLERTLLNFLGRLMGIATLTNRYVQEISGTKARIYDTRKTTPGWRRLEKYAVRCGGGSNHRTGLYDAILIKDNHLALRSRKSPATPADAAEAVAAARRFVQSSEQFADLPPLVEIEVDNLEQLSAVLSTQPDIVLLDNMRIEQLREAVALRGALAPQVELEASGGIQLENLREVAETGIDRISIGALTHSACTLDVGLDWHG